MQKLRQIHLYLGCFFAPMIILFALTGVWQELGMRRFPEWARYLSAIHTGSGMKGAAHHPSSVALQGFIVLMGLGLIVSVGTGIYLAFKYGRSKLALLCLISGILIPAAMIVIWGK
jgi:hypothetical protein